MSLRLFLARALIRLLGVLPLPLNHALGAALGELLAHVPNVARRAARVNISICFPDLAPAARRRLLRRSLRELGKTVTEVSYFWTRRPERLERLIKEVRGERDVRSNLDRGKGLIVAVPHQGAWELMALYWARRVPLHSLFRPPRDSALGPLLTQLRGRGGGQLHPATPAGIRALYKALAAGELVAILPDQQPRAGGGVFAPFFGRPALTMTLLGKIARRSGAPVVFAVAERLPWGRGYRIHLQVAPAGVDADEPAQAATALNSGVEACVALAPEQYQWSYRRFRHQPEGLHSPYRGPL